MQAPQKYSFLPFCTRNFLPWLLIFGLWASLILPSAFYSRWTYLDVPMVLHVSSVASLSALFIPDPSTGRFFPVFSAIYTLLFRIFGFNLQGYYLSQAILFLFVLTFLYGLVKRFTNSAFIPLIAVFLISTASPVAENFYTICKQDPLALFFVTFLIFLCHRHLEADSLPYSARRWFLLGSIGCIALVALLTKETTLVLLVFPIFGAVAAYLFFNRKILSDKGLFYSFGWMTIFVSGALATGRLLYSALKPANSPQIYLSYYINRELIWGNWEFYWKQQPDVILIGIVTLGILIFLYFRKETFPQQFIFASGLFLTGTAYFVGHLFWRWALGYYLLIPSALWGTALAISLGFLPRLSRGRSLLFAGLALIFLTRIYSLSYFYYIAKVQITQDQIYTAAIENYLRLAKNGERLFFEQWSFHEEGVHQSNILVHQIMNRPELKVEGTYDLLIGKPIPQEVLRLHGVPSANQEDRVPRAKDFVLVFTGKGQTSWILRGVAPFPNQQESAYRNLGMFMDLHEQKETKWRYLNAAHPFCFLKFEEYQKGFRLYQIKDASALSRFSGGRDSGMGKSIRDH